jgi:membrane associated rhomboid family serine protease
VIGVAVAFIVIGIVFLFLVPWVGIAAGAVGLVLAILWVAGFGRRAAARDTRADPPRT